MQVIELDFDERDPLYKCCCGIFHVKTGARITSVLNVIMSSSMIIQLYFIPYNLLFSIIEYAGIAAVTLSSASMFIATFTFRPKLVIAYLVTQLTLSILVSVLFIICMLSIFLPGSVGRFAIDNVLQLGILDDHLNGLSEEEANTEVVFVCFGFSIGLFLSFMWELLLLRVSFLCYNYLLDVRDAREGKAHLPPLRLESNAKRTVLVGLEHIEGIRKIRGVKYHAFHRLFLVILHKLSSFATKMVLVELEFDERDPLYKCCCGIFHVKTGTRILSSLNVVMSSSLMIIQLYFIPYNITFSIIEYVSVFAIIVSSISMFIATFTFWPKLVIGYLVTQLSLMIFASVLFIVCMVSIFLPESVGRYTMDHVLQWNVLDDDLSGLSEEAANSEIVLVAFAFAFGLFCSFMWEVFLLRVSFLCYNYLLDVRDAREGVSNLPPLRLESSARGVFLVGMEHVSTSCSNFQ